MRLKKLLRTAEDKTQTLTTALASSVFPLQNEDNGERNYVKIFLNKLAIIHVKVQKADL